MNLLSNPEVTGAVMPEPSRFVCAILFCLRNQCQGYSQSKLDRPGHASGRLSRLLGRAYVLAAASFVAALTASAQAQTSVTLAWNPSGDSGIAGYLLYHGVASGTYTNVIDVGRATSATVSNLISGVTNFFAVTVYYTNRQESDFSEEISYVVPWPIGPPPSGLTLAADSGTSSLPFSVILAWYPSPDGAIAGYRLYEGVGSGTYTNVINVGKATSATVSSLVDGVTYFFAVRAYDRIGQESGFSDEISYTNRAPKLALTLPVNGAVYVAPATINFAADVVPSGHTIKWVEFYNGLTLLGVSASAPYSFSWQKVGAGTYSLSAQVVYDSGSTVASAPFNVTVASRKIGSFYRLQEQ